MTKVTRLLKTIIVLATTMILVLGCNSSEDGNAGSTHETLESIIISSSFSKMRYMSTGQLTAIGTYSDGGTADITNFVTWTSSNADCVSISTSGLANALDMGTVTVNASMSGITSNNETLMTKEPVLVGLSREDGKLYYIDETDGSVNLMMTISDSTADSVSIDPKNFWSLAHDMNSGTLYAGTGYDASCPTCVFVIDTNGEASLFKNHQDDASIDAIGGIHGMDIGLDGDLYFVAGTGSHDLYTTSTDGSHYSRKIGAFSALIRVGNGNGLAFDTSGDLILIQEEEDCDGDQYLCLYTISTTDASESKIGDFSANFSIQYPTALAINSVDGRAYALSGVSFFEVNLSSADTNFISDNPLNIDGLTYIYGNTNFPPSITIKDMSGFLNSEISVNPQFFDDFNSPDELSITYQFDDASCASAYNDGDVLATNTVSTSFTADIEDTCTLEISVSDEEGLASDTSVEINVGGVWIEKAPIQTKRFAISSSVINNKIYAIGGYDGVVNSQVEEYDISTDTWRFRASLPAGRSFNSSSTVNGKIYTIGGYNSGSHSSVYEYDPSSNAWTPKTAMSTARTSFASGVVNNKIYIIGGGSNTIVEEYEPSSDSWTTKKSMPSARNYTTAGVVNNKIYVIGGYETGTGYVSTVEEYDPSSDAWATKTSMPTARGQATSSVVNNQIYVIGGYDGDRLSTVEAYDPSSDTWTTKTDMPTARDLSTSSSVNGIIYVIGGDIVGVNEYQSSPIVEAYNPNSDN